MIYNSLPCLMIKYTNPFSNIVGQKSKIVVALFGLISSSCPSGKIIHTLGKNKDVIFVVPEDFSVIDIENLRKKFNIKSKIKKAEPEMIRFLKNVERCNKTQFVNFLLYFQNGKLKKITLF